LNDGRASGEYHGVRGDRRDHRQGTHYGDAEAAVRVLPGGGAREAAAAGDARAQAPLCGRGVGEARHRERLAAGVARQAEVGRRGGRSGRPRLPTPSQGGRRGGVNKRTRPRPAPAAARRGAAAATAGALYFTRSALQ